MVWAYSSVVEHYVDIVGVPSSNLGTPTIEAFRGSKKPAGPAGFFSIRLKFAPPECLAFFRLLRFLSSET